MLLQIYKISVIIANVFYNRCTYKYNANMDICFFKYVHNDRVNYCYRISNKIFATFNINMLLQIYIISVIIANVFYIKSILLKRD